EVALDRSAVEAEPVLEAGTAAALDRDAEHADVGFLRHQLLDLRGRRLGDGHQRRDAFLNRHFETDRSNALGPCESPEWSVPAPNFVTVVSRIARPISPFFVSPRGTC